MALLSCSVKADSDSLCNSRNIGAASKSSPKYYAKTTFLQEVLRAYSRKQLSRLHAVVELQYASNKRLKFNHIVRSRLPIKTTACRYLAQRKPSPPRQGRRLWHRKFLCFFFPNRLSLMLWSEHQQRVNFGCEQRIEEEKCVRRMKFKSALKRLNRDFALKDTFLFPSADKCNTVLAKTLFIFDPKIEFAEADTPAHNASIGIGNFHCPT